MVRRWLVRPRRQQALSSGIIRRRVVVVVVVDAVVAVEAAEKTRRVPSCDTLLIHLHSSEDLRPMGIAMVGEQFWP